MDTAVTSSNSTSTGVNTQNSQGGVMQGVTTSSSSQSVEAEDFDLGFDTEDTTPTLDPSGETTSESDFTLNFGEDFPSEPNVEQEDTEMSNLSTENPIGTESFVEMQTKNESVSHLTHEVTEFATSDPVEKSKEVDNLATDFMIPSSEGGLMISDTDDMREKEENSDISLESPSRTEDTIRTGDSVSMEEGIEDPFADHVNEPLPTEEFLSGDPETLSSLPETNFTPSDTVSLSNESDDVLSSSDGPTANRSMTEVSSPDMLSGDGNMEQKNGMFTEEESIKNTSHSEEMDTSTFLSAPSEDQETSTENTFRPVEDVSDNTVEYQPTVEAFSQTVQGLSEQKGESASFIDASLLDIPEREESTSLENASGEIREDTVDLTQMASKVAENPNILTSIDPNENPFEAMKEALEYDEERQNSSSETSSIASQPQENPSQVNTDRGAVENTNTVVSSVTDAQMDSYTPQISMDPFGQPCGYGMGMNVNMNQNMQIPYANAVPGNISLDQLSSFNVGNGGMSPVYSNPYMTSQTLQPVQKKKKPSGIGVILFLLLIPIGGFVFYTMMPDTFYELVGKLPLEKWGITLPGLELPIGEEDLVHGTSPLENLSTGTNTLLEEENANTPITSFEGDPIQQEEKIIEEENGFGEKEEWFDSESEDVVEEENAEENFYDLIDDVTALQEGIDVSEEEVGDGEEDFVDFGENSSFGENIQGSEEEKTEIIKKLQNYQDTANKLFTIGHSQSDQYLMSTTADINTTVAQLLEELETKENFDIATYSTALDQIKTTLFTIQSYLVNGSTNS